MAVVHAHAEDTLPFGIAQGAKLRPVIHSGSFIGAEVPVWDIADKFGDTNLLVTNMAQANDLATCLGGNSVALMRGHGFASAARSLIEVVRALGLPAAQRAGTDVTRGNWVERSNTSRKARSKRAIAATAPYSVETWRSWEYWANKAGCGHLLTRPDQAAATQARPPKD